MHEAGLAERLVAAAIDAAPAGSGQITAIEVSAGAMAVPSVESLAFHVTMAAAGTRAHDATLLVEPDDDPWAVRLLAVTVRDGDDADAATGPAAPTGAQASRA